MKIILSIIISLAFYCPGHAQIVAFCAPYDGSPGGVAVGRIGADGPNVSTTYGVLIMEIAPETDVTGIQPVDYIGASVYPNPTYGLLNVAVPSSGRYFVDVFSIHGDVIHKTMIVNGKTEQINVAEFSSGIYFIKIYNGISNQTFKIIKE